MRVTDVPSRYGERFKVTPQPIYGLKKLWLHIKYFIKVIVLAPGVFIFEVLNFQYSCLDCSEAEAPVKSSISGVSFP